MQEISVGSRPAAQPKPQTAFAGGSGEAGGIRIDLRRLELDSAAPLSSRCGRVSIAESRAFHLLKKRLARLFVMTAASDTTGRPLPTFVN